MGVSGNSDDYPYSPQSEYIITDLATLKVFADEKRWKIMQIIANEAKTVQGIAEEVGVPFTQLYYHINLLEKHGLIQLVGTRRLPGAILEKYYRVTAIRYMLSPSIAYPGSSMDADGLFATAD